jgi:hypothetical protein
MGFSRPSRRSSDVDESPFSEEALAKFTGKVRPEEPVVEAAPEPTEADIAPFVSGPPSIGDFLSPSPAGIVVDPAVAKDAPCVAFELGGDGADADRLVFVQGIVGPLDEEQIATFCDVVAIKDLSPELQARLAAFRDAADACKSEGSGLEQHLGCMSKELHKRGEKL